MFACCEKRVCFSALFYKILRHSTFVKRECSTLQNISIMRYTFWLVKSGILVGTVLDFASVDLKAYLVFIEMGCSLNSRARSQNYLQPILGISFKAERTHRTTHWDGPEHFFSSIGSRRQLTFKEWPRNLSAAGFLYQGKSLC